jgi:hypothetical protein
MWILKECWSNFFFTLLALKKNNDMYIKMLLKGGWEKSKSQILNNITKMHSLENILSTYNIIFTGKCNTNI